MTVREKLLEEFGCAISAILGDQEDKEYDDNIDPADVDAIAKKVKWYLEK